jgi:hypothetical protein
MKKFIILLIFLLSGCAVPPFVSGIVTGVITWEAGKARKFYTEDTVVMQRATFLSLKNLGYKVKKFEPRKDGAYIVVAGGKTSILLREDRFAITIKKAKPKITELSMRINYLGDQPYAELIYKEIDNNIFVINYDDSGKPIN